MESKKNLINSKPVSKYILEYIFNKSEAGQRQIGNFGNIHSDYVEIYVCMFTMSPIFMLLFIVSILIKVISHLKVYFIYYARFPC